MYWRTAVLRKLQRKIIINNMIIVGSILAIFFAVYLIAVHNLSERNIREDLASSVYMMSGHDHLASDVTRSLDPRDPGGLLQEPKTVPTVKPEDRDKYYVARRNDCEVLVINSSGNIISINNEIFDLSSEQKQRIIDLAESGKNEQVLSMKDDHLFAFKYEKNRIRYVGIIDSDVLHDEMKNHYIRTFFLWLGIMALFLIISIVIARVVVRPVKRSWDKQQQFIADASHELKTPLTVIRANNNILLSPDSDLPQQSRVWVEGIEEESKHMQSLVEQMLFLAKSDADDQAIICEDVDFTETVSEDALQFDPVAFEKEIIIDTDIDSGIFVHGDGIQLRMLSHILLDNACKYAEPGSKITVTLKNDIHGCVLKVHNNGSYISEEDMPYIFERFYRTDKSRTLKEVSTGYGLGLPIAKTVCENHNGSIKAESSPEKGTVFTAVLRGMK
jgi:two-component system sensor histidine kinase CiaH